MLSKDVKLKHLGGMGKTKEKKNGCKKMPHNNIETLWEKDLDCNNKSHTFKPFINKDYILINADGFTKKFDLDGTRIFNVRTGALNHVRPVIDREENIYIVNSEEIVSLFPTGNIRWRTKVGEVNHAPLIDDDGMLYLAARDSHAIALNPDGTIYWRKKVNELESSQPFVDNQGFLHLRLFEGSHIVINRKRGFFNPENPPAPSPAGLMEGCITETAT